MHTQASKLVLFALAPASKEAFFDAIPHNFNCYWCTSLAQAQALRYAKLDLIVCCTQFDSSQMFELLRYCKASATMRTTPVLCLRAVEGAYDDAAFQSVSVACKALGAVGFFDLSRKTVESGRTLALKAANVLLSRLCDTKAGPPILQRGLNGQ